MTERELNYQLNAVKRQYGEDSKQYKNLLADVQGVKNGIRHKVECLKLKL